jgi:hypothetical protein
MKGKGVYACVVEGSEIVSTIDHWRVQGTEANLFLCRRC